MTDKIERINPGAINPPGGHYSHAVKHNGTIYISGQIGRIKGMSDDEAGGIEKQTRRCLNNIFSILESAGSSKERLLKVNIYVSDMDDWDAVNKIYSEMIGDHKPARLVVPTPNLHFNALLEIDAIAAG